MATSEAIWLKRILKDLEVPIKDLTPLYYDNMSSIYLAGKPMFHTHTKHIEVHYHFIWERIVVKIHHYVRIVRRNSQGIGREGLDVFLA